MFPWRQGRGPRFMCELLCVLRTIMGPLSSWAPSVSCGRAGCSGYVVLHVFSPADVWGLWHFSVDSTLWSLKLWLLATSSLWCIINHPQVLTSWASHPQLPVPPNYLQGIPTLPFCGILLHSWVILRRVGKLAYLWTVCFLLSAHVKPGIPTTLISDLREISVTIFVFFPTYFANHPFPAWLICCPICSLCKVP